MNELNWFDEIVLRLRGNNKEEIETKSSKKSKKTKSKGKSTDLASVHEPPAKWRIVVCNLAAGATAGCVVEAALYPIDTIKTRLQSMREKGDIRVLLQQGGGKSLYAGVGGNLLGAGIASALFMGSYEPCKRWLDADLPNQFQYLSTFVAGAVGGLTASIVRVPTEVVKQRLQMGQFNGPVSAVTQILSKQGPQGLFAGYSAFMMRDLPFDAIQFCIYESVRRIYRGYLDRDINGVETSIMGGVSGAITGAVTTPLDVIKTRLMVQGTTNQYRNLWQCCTSIYKEEGMAAFMKGWQPRVTWITIGGCVFFSALEYSKKLYAPKGYDPSTDKV